MNCADIDRALARQNTLLPDALTAEAGEHVRDCPRCSALLEMLSAPPSGGELRPEPGNHTLDHGGARPGNTFMTKTS